MELRWTHTSDQEKDIIIKLLTDQGFNFVSEEQIGGECVLTFEKNDAGSYENIQVIESADGKRSLIANWYDLYDEIDIPEAIIQHGYDSLTEKEVEWMAGQAQKEIKKWEKTVVNKHNICLERITIENTCYVNIPHPHIYKGYFLNIRDLDGPLLRFLLSDVSTMLYFIEHIFS